MVKRIITKSDIMKKFQSLITGLILTAATLFGQGETIVLRDKDRGQDIMTLLQRLKPCRIMGNQIFFNYEVNSLNSPQGALIVIDGVKVGNDASSLYAVPVTDMASITVMTHPEDYVIYTSLNVNGVIIIKTRR